MLQKSKCTLYRICFCLQALAALPENKNVIFLKVDVDDASVSVRLFQLQVILKYMTQIASNAAAT